MTAPAIAKVILTENPNPYARNYGPAADDDPSVAGFHESSDERVLRVDFQGGANPGNFVNLRQSLDDLDRVTLEVETRDDTFDDIFEIRRNGFGMHVKNRFAVRRLADALRYAADKGFGRGYFDALPAENHGFILPEHAPGLSAEKAMVILQNVMAAVNAPCQGARNYPRGCDCDVCDTARSAPFCCDACGYSGVPLVHACTCVPSWQKDYTATLERMQEGGEGYDPKADEYHLGYLERHKPTTIPCDGSDEDRYDNCLHTHPECPVCLGMDCADDSSYFDTATFIMSIRAALRGAAVTATRPCIDCELPLASTDGPEIARCDSCTDAMMERRKVAKGDVATEVLSPGREQFRKDAAARMDGGRWTGETVIEGNGEKFVLLGEVPRPEGIQPADVDRAAVDRSLSWVQDVFTTDALPELAKRLGEANLDFEGAARRIVRGERAWPENEYGHGEKEPKTLVDLQAEYVERLEDCGIVDAEWHGVWTTDGDPALHEEPGLYVDVEDSHSARFTLALGRRRWSAAHRFRSDAGDEEPNEFLADLDVRVTGDATLQALVATFLTGLRDRYMITTEAEATEPAPEPIAQTA